jgi:hemoglobin
MSTSSEQKITPYDKLGGEPALRRLVDRFYEIMDTVRDAQELRAMHARDLEPIRAKLFDFMSGWLGGPNRYQQRPDATCIVSAHARFAIGTAETNQWISCMEQALDDTEAPADVQQLLRPALRHAAWSFKNR